MYAQPSYPTHGIRPANWLIILIFLLGNLSCYKHNVSGPGDENPAPQLPKLADPIPYEQLGTGTILFERIGPRGVYSGLYVLDVENRQSTPLAINPLSSDYNLSPDGRTIAFSMFTDFASLYDIYTLGTDSTNLMQLDALPGQDRSATWSPDGNKIYFWSMDVEPNMYVQSSVANTNDRQVVRRLTYQFEQGGTEWLIVPSGPASVATDGTIAFVTNSNRDMGLAGLYTMDSDGTKLQQVATADDSTFLDSPVFSADGQQINYLRVQRDSLYAYQRILIMQVDLSTDPITPTVLAELPAGGIQEWAYPSKVTAVTLARAPGGNQFLLNIPEDDFTSHLYLLDAGSRNLTQVTFADSVTDRFVSWGR